MTERNGLEVDAMLDRRRLSRKVAFWRGLAIVVVLAAIVTGVALQAGLFEKKHVARLPISGAIFAERPLLKTIERLRKNDNVAGVVLAINSPGGTSVGGEKLYNALRRLNEAKPVVAHINTLGASAAYMAALSSDHIVAQRNSLTGSIGVLIQYGQVSQLLEKIGVSVTKVESGPLKAEPTPFEPATPQAVALLQSVVDDTFAYFLELVIERRNLSDAEAREAADGRIFTGAQALEAKLIDAIGGERDAVRWMEDERGIPKSLPMRDYKPDSSSALPLSVRVTDRVMDRVLSAFGVSTPPSLAAGSVDGLWSLWQGRPPSDK